MHLVVPSLTEKDCVVLDSAAISCSGLNGTGQDETGLSCYGLHCSALHLTRLDSTAIDCSYVLALDSPRCCSSACCYGHFFVKHSSPLLPIFQL